MNCISKNVFIKARYLRWLTKRSQCIANIKFIARSYVNNTLDESQIKNGLDISRIRCFSTCNNIIYQENKCPSGNGDQAPTSKLLTVPNILTFGRLLISPYLGYLVLAEEFQLALILFCISGVTDSVDGWIARNVKGQSSIIGSFIDPLADKVLITILTISLGIVGAMPGLLCGLIVTRDILLVGTSSHFHYKNLSPPKTLSKFFDFENSKVKMEPTQISKYNTFLQLGLITLSLGMPVFNISVNNIVEAYWYLVGTTTVVSGCSYFFKDKAAYKIQK